jgi:integrase
MGKVITSRFVEAAKPKRNEAGAAVRTEYPDAACPGLYLVVQPSGTRSWAFRFRHQGVTGKKTLGSAAHGGLSLSAARAAAATWRHQLEQGVMPVQRADVTGVTGKSGGGGDSIETTVASFLELHARRKNRPSTAWASERIFNRLVLPAWRGRSIDSIRKRDVIDLVESIAISGRGYLANRTLGILSKFFNWLIARDELVVSPVTGIERPHKEKARDRTLDDAELRALWLACEGEGPFGQALRLLILTGTRRNEVSYLPWSEIREGGRLWVLPAERSKNRREHIIPLSSQAWKLLESMPQFADCNYVFTADGRRPIIGWAKAKTRISAKAGLDETSWRLHDLRRTTASGMQRLGFRTEVIERCLNHVSGTFRGIVGTYQTDPLEHEVRAALQAWTDYVTERVVGDKPAKVITLRGKQRP